jgi:hypothetical protein
MKALGITGLLIALSATDIYITAAGVALLYLALPALQEE